MRQDIQSVKEDIRTRSDIVEVVGVYVRLQKAGKDYKGLCPFHSDKRPSLHVSPSMQIYKCYSCGEGGDVFTFIQKIEKLDFIESLEWLARRAGISFHRQQIGGETASGKREQMLEINLLTRDFFQEQLKKSKDAQEYLSSRGILKETQERWDIGFATPEWDAFTEFLIRKKLDIQIAVELGLVKPRKSEGSGWYDSFRNRIILPIHDMNGQPIAFGGRSLSSDEPAKYINSDNSIVFDKSRSLYGLYFARKIIGKEIPPVFVEGYLDVISAHQAGFNQCVATLGTSMTEAHARSLARYSPKVIICYDRDEAGIKAAQRGAMIWEELGIEGSDVRITQLPDGQDPDSLLMQPDGISQFQRSLDAALGRVDFQLAQILLRHNLETEEGKQSALAEGITLLGTVKVLSKRSRYADKLARLHPLASIGSIDRAIAQIMQDAATASDKLKGGEAPRAQGYPLTEQMNGGPLREQPPLPPYRPEWGQFRRATGWKYGNRSLEAPLPVQKLRGTEKAERQLLRALFSAEWRINLLSRLNSELMATQEGAFLLELIARTPPESDGNLSPAAILERAEEERNTGEETETALHAEYTAKISQFLREILEESSYLVSNESITEEAIADCLTKLQKGKAELTKSELARQLRQEMSADKQRILLEKYHKQVRELRGN